MTHDTPERLHRIDPDVTSRLGISVSTARRLLNSGALKRVRIGKSVRVSESALVAYIRSLDAASSDAA